jgi:large subunit ribosomal protein L22
MAKKETKQVNIPVTANASLRYLRISPRKVRLVANVIKKLPVSEAEAQLMLHPRRPASIILKLLRSAVSNAKNKKLEESKLFISDIRVNQGPILKRWIPRAQGRATPIHKNTSHVEITLKESEKPVQSRFITEIKKVKKPKKEVAHKHEHEEEGHEHAEEKAKQLKTEKQEKIKKERKASEKREFVQKLFRRKSI